MRSLRCILALWLLSGTVASAPAADRAWIIGGGPRLMDSQAQIEANVRRARDLLADVPGAAPPAVYFTDGADPAPDVMSWTPPAAGPEALQPLARVYDAYVVNGRRYRNHALGAVDGPATEAAVRDALGAGLAALSPGGAALVVFAGHGVGGERPRESRMLLWGGGALDVGEVRGLLDRAPARARVRFVLTQCYGGGFAELVYREPGGETLAAADRCGFMAAPWDRPAEGCAAALDAEPRDYITRFLDALAADAGHGGRLTPYAAHMRAVTTARSADVPLATSEHYLLRRAPFWLDWWPWRDALPGNRFGRAARALADDLGLVPADDALTAHREVVRLQIGRLQRRQRDLREAIAARRAGLRTALEARWPEAAWGHTAAYREFLRRDLDAAQAFLLDHPDYPALAADQEQYWVLEEAVVELERRLALVARIERLGRLARALDQLERGGPADERAAYGRLLACERAPL